MGTITCGFRVFLFYLPTFIGLFVKWKNRDGCFMGVAGFYVMVGY